jgi:transposase
VASRSRAIWDWCRWRIPADSGDDWDTSPKQGNSVLRFLLVEAAQVTVRSDPEWRSKYFHLAMRRGRKIAKVAMARRLAVRLYWMWRKGRNYEQLEKVGSHAGQPGNRHGVKSNTE